MEDLQGYVEHIVFRNADNGYTVLNLISEEDEITCVGIFPVVTEGEILLLHGEYTSHPTYGEQFQMKSYEAKAPEDVLSMERYLASGAIKGIGVALASRIVRLKVLRKVSLYYHFFRIFDKKGQKAGPSCFSPFISTLCNLLSIQQLT